jgi:hypothetical protein
VIKLLRVLMLLLVAAVVSGAEYYTVCLTRVRQDLYRDTITHAWVQTEYCYKYVTNDDAVLQYEPYSQDNFVAFSDGDTCKVVKVYR